MSWRDLIPVHPAARKFELLTGRDRDDFDEDIFRRGIIEPVSLWLSPEDELFVLDGQNRLDAVERRIGEITVDHAAGLYVLRPPRRCATGSGIIVKSRGSSTALKLNCRQGISCQVTIRKSLSPASMCSGGI